MFSILVTMVVVVVVGSTAALIPDYLGKKKCV
jgi:hypothetical protein